MKIKAVRTSLYDIPPEVERVDAIQTFVSMEFPFIEIEDVDGVVGTGFSYTIGKGGEAIKQIMDAYLTPILLEEDASTSTGFGIGCGWIRTGSGGVALSL